MRRPLRKMAGTPALWAGVMLLIGASWARSASDDGLKVFDHITHAQAVALVEKADQGGDPQLLDYAGWVMEKGLGVEANLLQAGKYFNRAGDKGNNLAWEHLIDLSGQKGFVEEVQKAADRTDAEAQNLLGELYAHGWGVDTDYLQAAACYRKAANQGFAPAVRNMGMIYEMGRGVRRDYPAAVKYFEKAAAKDDPAAVEALGKAHQEGWGVTKDHQKAVTYYQRAARLGTLDAQNDLGWAHQHGIGVPKDLAEAKRHYEIAADSGNANAANNLGYLYHRGLGTTKDETEALKWYLRGIHYGNADSSHSMERMDFEDGSDPVVVMKGKTVVRFAFDRSELTGEGMERLQVLADYLAWAGNVKVKVDGYCDLRGKEAYNQKLSERRAETIKQVLIYHGVPEEDIRAAGHGSGHPVAPNDTEAGQAKNRRVEIRVKGLN